MTIQLRLQKIYQVSGKIRLLTGLHIGSGDTEMHIGGVDNLVIRHPHTNEPYIPGSSLKGKTRSLLELYYGIPFFAYQKDSKSGGLANTKLLEKGTPDNIKRQAEKILKIFGVSGSAEDSFILETIGPSRVAFFDCFYTNEYRQKITSQNLLHTEIKAENRINRITGTAEHPRFTERVPAGAEFDFQVTFKVYADTDHDLFKEVLRGLCLLELDYLGGSGSRGYGRIKFHFEDNEIMKEFEDLKKSLWNK